MFHFLIQAQHKPAFQSERRETVWLDPDALKRSQPGGVDFAWAGCVLCEDTFLAALNQTQQTLGG